LIWVLANDFTEETKKLWCKEHQRKSIRPYIKEIQ
jgi:hypothetical protein